MHIQNRTAMALFDLVIGLFAALATWIQFSQFGNEAWRLFATWVASFTTIYYIVDAAIVFFSKRRPIGREVCPMLQGALIIAGITVPLIHIICRVMGDTTMIAVPNVAFLEIILPVLMIMSWVMFSEKSKWHAYDPFYWLGLFAGYIALSLIIGEFIPHSNPNAYLYAFLDYPRIGIDNMLLWLAIIAVAILIVGYLFWLLGFAFSGQLTERVVMPKIKTIVIEEEIADEPSPDEKPDEKPEEKPVKLVTTGSRNLPVLQAQRSKRAASASKSSATSSTTKPQPSSKNSTKKRIIEKIEITDVKSTKNPTKKTKDTKDNKGTEGTKGPKTTKDSKASPASPEKPKSAKS